MKKRIRLKDKILIDNKQEICGKLKDDLLTVLEAYIDEMEVEKLFYEAISFCIKALYECVTPNSHALKILRFAMYVGITDKIEKGNN